MNSASRRRWQSHLSLLMGNQGAAARSAAAPNYYQRGGIAALPERRFPMWEYRNMASTAKAAYSERKCPKSTFILTVNYSIYPCFKATIRLPHKLIKSTCGQMAYFTKSCYPPRLIDWYLIRLLFDSLVFLLFSIYLCGIFPVWFFHVWICHIWIIHVWIFPMWSKGKSTWFALWAAFLYAGISEYGKSLKSRLQRKKMPKINPYPDSKLSCLSAI